MEKTEIMRRFIHQEVVKALINSRAPYEGALCRQLEAESEIVGQTACVRVLDENGGWIMLEDRIKELRVDPRFRDSFPSPTRIERHDESGVRDQFEAIANGSAIVD